MTLNQRDILVTPIPGQLIDTSVVSSSIDGTVFSAPAHGLTVGKLVRVGALSPSGLVLSSKITSQAAQFMVSEVVDINNIRLAKSGDSVTVSGFADGDSVFLGDAGDASSTQASVEGEIDQFIGQILGGQVHLNFTIAITV